MTDSGYEENVGGSILKTDVIGRVQTSAAQREGMLDQFERSGLSGTKFAAVAGVKYQTFASWVQKRRRATGAYSNRSKKSVAKKPAGRGASALPALGWVEAVVRSDVTPDRKKEKVTLRLELPGGACVLIADEAGAVLAAELLKRLQPSPDARSC